MVPLVHSMWSDSATKCLIVKDLDEKHEDTIDMTEELLKEHQVTGITKVLPLDQLKKEHKGKLNLYLSIMKEIELGNYIIIYTSFRSRVEKNSIKRV